jgi:hypothetical protein
MRCFEGLFQKEVNHVDSLGYSSNIDMPTINALCGVHALHAATRRASPPLPLGLDERPNAVFMYRTQIFEHAHPVLLAIPSIQPL